MIKLINYTKALTKDYFIFLKATALDLFAKKVPDSWATGDKGTIVLILGFNEGINFLKPIGNMLNARGYKIIFPKAFSRFKSVKKLSSEIIKELQEKNINEYKIIAHSKGGLVGKCMIVSEPEKAEKLVAISTPWQGTYVGKLGFLNLGELKPNSELVKFLNKNNQVNKKIVNIRAKFDQYMPAKADVLEDSINIEIDHIGHGVQFSKETINKILQVI